MKNWLIKLLGGYTEKDGDIAEYSAGFADGHAVGFKAGEVSADRKNVNAIMAPNGFPIIPIAPEKKRPIKIKKSTRIKTKKKLKKK